ncbi:hypothetical protein ARMSODRAFT_967714 [Armillaria solidipes]|uniref:Uncharacterized protein n=1 Tax=Armillaria solidipes TaxID=1076256 RepID=A0A2H3B3M7_9AGAR|nr:hypothetical protein ARMSODRAFT_967714 [Armillaria solidipes]
MIRPCARFDVSSSPVHGTWLETKWEHSSDDDDAQVPFEDLPLETECNSSTFEAHQARTVHSFSGPRSLINLCASSSIWNTETLRKIYIVLRIISAFLLIHLSFSLRSQVHLEGILVCQSCSCTGPVQARESKPLSSW